jgi:hypothetical protein
MKKKTGDKKKRRCRPKHFVTNIFFLKARAFTTKIRELFFVLRTVWVFRKVKKRLWWIFPSNKSTPSNRKKDFHTSHVPKIKGNRGIFVFERLRIFKQKIKI